MAIHRARGGGVWASLVSQLNIGLGSLTPFGMNAAHSGRTCCAILGPNPEVTNSDNAIVGIGNTSMTFMRDMSPCLTANHAADRAYWSLSRRRRLTITEIMRLQGVSASRFDGWENVISERQMGKLAGNAMTVTILARIAARMFCSMGYPVYDPVQEAI